MDEKQRFRFGLVSIFVAFLWRKKSGVKSNDFEDIKNQVLDKPILKSKYKSGEYRYYSLIGDWLIEQGWCDAVTSSWPENLGGSRHPDIVGVREKDQTIIFTEVKMKTGNLNETIKQLEQYKEHSNIVFLALEHKCAWFEQVFRYCSNNGIGIIEFKPKGKVIDINLKNVPKINRN